MRTDSWFCEGCDRHVDHVAAGFMPTYFITEEDTETWQNISVCSDCGDVRIKSVEPEDVRRAHERYLEILVEEGVMSEEEIKQELQ